MLEYEDYVLIFLKGVHLLSTWTKNDMQDQTGKVVIVTGANRGLGFQTSLALAEKGATVILAVRDLHQGRLAQEKIQAFFPDARVDVMYLNLDELASIKPFSQEFKKKYNTLSILINNAGVMSKQLQKTKDGYESQFGINYMGHFVLTCHLLDYLKSTPHSRVVSLGSMIAHKSKPSFGHFYGSDKYKMTHFYAQSKLACMFFAKLLDQRFKDNKILSKSIACHPGIASTNLFTQNSSKQSKKITNVGMKVLGQDVITGALPILFAATENSLSGGEYIGPNKKRKGSPIELTILNDIYDGNVANNLWNITEKLCGVSFRF